MGCRARPGALHRDPLPEGILRLKLDENLGKACAELLLGAGHDISTVFEQGMTSASDEIVLEACRREERGLVTLDLDFANPLRYRPAENEGIAVIRLPRRCARAHLEAAVTVLVGGLARAPIRGKLWIVQPGLIREYQDESTAS